VKDKIKKYLVLMISICIIFIIVIPFYNRLLFGVWNPFDAPERINCYGRRYYISKLEPIDSVKNQELLQSIKWPHNLTLKKLYMDPGSIIIKVPGIIYTKTNDGKYQQYVLSGSD